jgi:hypothetical protein
MAIHTCLVTYIYLVTCICPTNFSDVGFCPTKFKLCLTKIKSDRTNVLSTQIFICSPVTARTSQRGGGGGGKGGNLPRAPVKGAPKNCKRGATKGVIKNKIVWNVFYK